MAIAHKDIPDSGLHEPKGVASAAAGTVYVANGSGSGSWIDPIPTDLPRLGWANYSDYSSSVVAQSITSSTWTTLANDGLGAQTNTDYLPTGVISLWNPGPDQLDFSDLPLGSEVELRLNMNITTSAANQAVLGRLSLAIGHGSAYTLPTFNQQFKSAGTYGVSIYTGLFIGNEFTRDYPGEIQIWTDASATVRVSGWYIKVTRVSV